MNIIPKSPVYKYALGLLLIAVMISLMVIFFLNANNKPIKPNNPEPNSSLQQHRADDKPKQLKIFTPQEFSDLYKNYAHPNTQKIAENSKITGNEKVDSHIKSIAEKRGYFLQTAPVSSAFIEIDNKIVLQQKAAAGWVELKESARVDNIRISVTEGYRSELDQKEIFLNRLGNISTSEIMSGSKDAHINAVLATTAPPGYSRHHSGYTIDIECDEQKNVRFKNSSCFEWLQKDNYKKAKQSGWMPSYPDGAANQGPEPEAWEYVWMGKAAFLE